MAHSIETHLTAIKNAADRASGTMRVQASAKTNREAYRAFLADCFASFEALAYDLGGDGAYISDEYTGTTGENGCVDSVFLDRIEAESGKSANVIYSARRPSEGTLTHVQQGIVHGARI